MSTSRGRSLSERLDRDGIDAVLRKAEDIGGDAPGIAEKYAALQRGFDALRSLDPKTGVSEEDLAVVVQKIESHVSEGGDVEDAAAMRKPPFPETEEETKAMSDDLSSADDAGKKEEPPAEAEQPRKSMPPVAAAKRPKEAEKTDSGVVNLKALAEDYYRAKAQREKAAAPAAADAAEAGAPAAAPRRKQSLGVFFAVAASLVAVCGVLVYLLMSRGGGDTAKRSAPAGPPAVAAAESAVSAPPAEASAVEMPPAPPDNATAEELERYREEVERLKAELAEREAARAVEPASPAEPEATAAAFRGAGRRGGVVRTSRPRRHGDHGDAALTPGTTSTRPHHGDAADPAPGAPTEANPLISMLGVARPRSGGTSTTAPRRDAGTATSDPATRRAGGQWSEAWRRSGQPPPPPPPPTDGTAPPPPPPPPPPPEENLPETLGRRRCAAAPTPFRRQGLRVGNTGTIIVSSPSRGPAAR